VSSVGRYPQTLRIIDAACNDPRALAHLDCSWAGGGGTLDASAATSLFCIRHRMYLRVQRDGADCQQQRWPAVDATPSVSGTPPDRRGAVRFWPVPACCTISNSTAERTERALCPVATLRSRVCSVRPLPRHRCGSIPRTMINPRRYVRTSGGQTDGRTDGQPSIAAGREPASRSRVWQTYVVTAAECRNMMLRSLASWAQLTSAS